MVSPEGGLALSKCNDVMRPVGCLQDSQGHNVRSSLEQAHGNLAKKRPLVWTRNRIYCMYVIHLRFVHDSDEPAVDVDDDVSLANAALVRVGLLLHAAENKVKTKLVAEIIQMRQAGSTNIAEDITYMYMG